MANFHTKGDTDPYPNELKDASSSSFEEISWIESPCKSRAKVPPSRVCSSAFPTFFRNPSLDHLDPFEDSHHTRSREADPFHSDAHRSRAHNVCPRMTGMPVARKVDPERNIDDDAESVRTESTRASTGSQSTSLSGQRERRALKRNKRPVVDKAKTVNCETTSQNTQNKTTREPAFVMSDFPHDSLGLTPAKETATTGPRRRSSLDMVGNNTATIVSSDVASLSKDSERKIRQQGRRSSLSNLSKFEHNHNSAEQIEKSRPRAVDDESSQLRTNILSSESTCIDECASIALSDEQRGRMKKASRCLRRSSLNMTSNRTNLNPQSDCLSLRGSDRKPSQQERRRSSLNNLSMSENTSNHSDKIGPSFAQSACDFKPSQGLSRKPPTQSTSFNTCNPSAKQGEERTNSKGSQQRRRSSLNCLSRLDADTTSQPVAFASLSLCGDTEHSKSKSETFKNSERDNKKGTILEEQKALQAPPFGSVNKQRQRRRSTLNHIGLWESDQTKQAENHFEWTDFDGNASYFQIGQNPTRNQSRMNTSPNFASSFSEGMTVGADEWRKGANGMKELLTSSVPLSEQKPLQRAHPKTLQKKESQVTKRKSGRRPSLNMVPNQTAQSDYNHQSLAAGLDYREPNSLQCSGHRNSRTNKGSTHGHLPSGENRQPRTQRRRSSLSHVVPSLESTTLSPPLSPKNRRHSLTAVESSEDIGVVIKSNVGEILHRMVTKTVEWPSAKMRRKKKASV
jgi:hypothetical protein